METERRVSNIFQKLRAEIQKPQTELDFLNEFTFCVAVILSAQSTDKAVNKVMVGLQKAVKTPEDMVKLGEDKLKDFIKSIGLYNNKAKNIMLLADILVRELNSSIPQDRDVLETLPGIGRKSANVIANTLFGLPYIAVDTHVLRVSNRLDLSKGVTPIAVEKDLIKMIPIAYHKHASNLLVLHGRYICTAKNPKCESCVLKELCNSNYNKTRSYPKS